jgi:hypothetical protein
MLKLLDRVLRRNETYLWSICSRTLGFQIYSHALSNSDSNYDETCSCANPKFGKKLRNIQIARALGAKVPIHQLKRTERCELAPMPVSLAEKALQALKECITPGGTTSEELPVSVFFNGGIFTLVVHICQWEYFVSFAMLLFATFLIKIPLLTRLSCSI